MDIQQMQPELGFYAFLSLCLLVTSIICYLEHLDNVEFLKKHDREDSVIILDEEKEY